jgi:hypothetical protein
MSTTMRILQRTVEEDDAPIDDHKDVVLLGLFGNGWRMVSDVLVRFNSPRRCEPFYTKVRVNECLATIDDSGAVSGC